MQLKLIFFTIWYSKLVSIVIYCSSNLKLKTILLFSLSLSLPVSSFPFLCRPSLYHPALSQSDIAKIHDRNSWRSTTDNGDMRWCHHQWWLPPFPFFFKNLFLSYSFAMAENLSFPIVCIFLVELGLTLGLKH